MVTRAVKEQVDFRLGSWHTRARIRSNLRSRAVTQGTCASVATLIGAAACAFRTSLIRKRSAAGAARPRRPLGLRRLARQLRQATDWTLPMCGTGWMRQRLLAEAKERARPAVISEAGLQCWPEST